MTSSIFALISLCIKMLWMCAKLCDAMCHRSLCCILIWCAFEQHPQHWTHARYIHAAKLFIPSCITPYPIIIIIIMLVRCQLTVCGAWCGRRRGRSSWASWRWAWSAAGLWGSLHRGHAGRQGQRDTWHAARPGGWYPPCPRSDAACACMDRRGWARQLLRGELVGATLGG